MIDTSKPYFPSTGLKQKSLIKLRRIGTFQPETLKEGQGNLLDELISEMHKKLIKGIMLTE